MIFTEYNQNLTKFIKHKITTDDKHPDKQFVKQILRSITTNRDELNIIVEEAVLEDVKKIISFSDKTKEDVKTIFFTKSYAHIRAISVIYLQQTGRPINEIFLEKFTRNKEILTNIISFAQDPTNYFAKCLVTCLKKSCFDRYILNCVMILRCEVDMVDIKEEFFKMTEEMLREAINRETSGTYKLALLELLGEKKIESSKERKMSSSFSDLESLSSLSTSPK